MQARKNRACAIQGLYSVDIEGRQYASLLVRVLLSLELHKTKRRHVPGEQKKA